MLTDEQLHQIARNKLTRSTLAALEKTVWKDGIDVQVLRTETLHFLRAIEAEVRKEYAETTHVCRACASAAERNERRRVEAIANSGGSFERFQQIRKQQREGSR